MRKIERTGQLKKRYTDIITCELSSLICILKPVCRALQQVPVQGARDHCVLQVCGKDDGDVHSSYILDVSSCFGG